LISTSPPVRGEDDYTKPSPRALEQTPALDSAKRASSLYTDYDLVDLFDGRALPSAPDFLPPEAWADGPMPIPTQRDIPAGRPSFRVAQYPIEDTAARDVDPEGHSQEPRWNPAPPLSPDFTLDKPDGFVWKERALTATI